MAGKIVPPISLGLSLIAIAISGLALNGSHTVENTQNNTLTATENIPPDSTDNLYQSNLEKQVDSILKHLSDINHHHELLSERVLRIEKNGTMPVSTTSPQPSSKPAETYNEHQVKEEQALRFSKLEELYINGTADINATTQIDEAFKSAINSKQLEGTSITSINCHNTLCKVRANHDTPQAIDNYIHNFASFIPWGMAAEIEYTPTRNGVTQTVFYVSRGDDFPDIR